MTTPLITWNDHFVALMEYRKRFGTINISPSHCGESKMYQTLSMWRTYQQSNLHKLNDEQRQMWKFLVNGSIHNGSPRLPKQTASVQQRISNALYASHSQQEQEEERRRNKLSIDVWDDDDDEDEEQQSSSSTAPRRSSHGSQQRKLPTQQQQQQEKFQVLAPRPAEPAEPAETLFRHLTGMDDGEQGVEHKDSVSEKSGEAPRPTSYRGSKQPLDKAKVPAVKCSNHHKQWDMMYERLTKYKEKYGNCNVPVRYADDPPFGKWVSRQREMYAKESLAKARIRRLQLLQFQWRVGKPNPNLGGQAKYEENWMQRYKQLVMYKRQYGDFRIPMDYHDKQFRGWVHKQRSAEIRNDLRPDRKALLTEIGFWDEILDYPMKNPYAKQRTYIDVKPQSKQAIKKVRRRAPSEDIKKTTQLVTKPSDLLKNMGISIDIPMDIEINHGHHQEHYKSADWMEEEEDDDDDDEVEIVEPPTKPKAKPPAWMSIDFKTKAKRQEQQQQNISRQNSMQERQNAMQNQMKMREMQLQQEMHNQAQNSPHLQSAMNNNINNNINNLSMLQPTRHLPFESTPAYLQRSFGGQNPQALQQMMQQRAVMQQRQAAMQQQQAAMQNQMQLQSHMQLESQLKASLQNRQMQRQRAQMMQQQQDNFMQQEQNFPSPRMQGHSEKPVRPLPQTVEALDCKRLSATTTEGVVTPCLTDDDDDDEEEPVFKKPRIAVEKRKEDSRNKQVTDEFEDDVEEEEIKASQLKPIGRSIIAPSVNREMKAVHNQLHDLAAAAIKNGTLKPRPTKLACRFVTRGSIAPPTMADIKRPRLPETPLMSSGEKQPPPRRRPPTNAPEKGPTTGPLKHLFPKKRFNIRALPLFRPSSKSKSPKKANLPATITPDRPIAPIALPAEEARTATPLKLVITHPSKIARHEIKSFEDAYWSAMKTAPAPTICDWKRKRGWSYVV